MAKVVVAALYKFVSLPDYKQIRPLLLKICNDNQVKGTLLLAEEGINGTIAGTRQGIDAVLAYLHSDIRFDSLEYKESFATEMPFYRMKVRLKKEIVTLGVPTVDPTKVVGTYVDPKDWNALISDPDVIVIDTRNDYEYGIGTFRGALDPKTKTFREFPQYVRTNLNKNKHKKVAMFCTGGIRCEKASSFMLQEGFEEVYHLKGGILKYLETIPPEESLWDGECFVFDHRVTVQHGLQEGIYETCYGCRRPVSPEDKTSSKYQEGVHCPQCFNSLTGSKKKRASDRHLQVKLAQQRHTKHIGQ
jgi:UPF0176 protein